jgi:hypothetical protein
MGKDGAEAFLRHQGKCRQPFVRIAHKALRSMIRGHGAAQILRIILHCGLIFVFDEGR